ncbi:MAG: MFS transporter [Aquiluna sp.]|nr:MFS transporter [Aquiluna sp.]MCF8545612.1 MFS transporter [Aquiluna sp.]
MIKLQATKARNALWMMFFVMGVVSMAWVPRIPEIKEANGLSDTAFGLVLISSSVGAVFGAQLAGRLIHRFGSRPAMYFSSVVVPLGVVIMGLSTNAFVLVLGLFVMGFSYAALDVGGNAQAVAIEKHLSKGYMASFHGMWSLGTLFSTILGALVAYLLTPAQNLFLVAGVGFVLFFVAARRLLPFDLDGHKGDGETETKNSVPWFAIATIPLWFMGIGAAASFIAEGSAADWGALLLRDFMNVEKGFNASAFATFALAMILSRFLGDSWLERFGPYRVVRYLGVGGGVVWGVLILAGVALSDANPLLALVIVNFGFFWAGIAIGPMFPAFIVGAAAIKGIAPSIGIARVGVISIGAFFLGPSLVGYLSDLITLPLAMMYPAAALVLAGVLAKVLR